MNGCLRTILSALGRTALAARHMREVGPLVFYRDSRNRRHLLPLVSRATPVDVSVGDFELHMLLNHPRVYEGMWAVHSFAAASSRRFLLCIHDDGTLTPQDRELLSRAFHGVRIIDRQFADGAVTTFLEDKGCPNCARFRAALVLSLKLFDAVILSRSETLLLLDSDVLFFSEPRELLSHIDGGRSAFSVDFGYEDAYCARVARSVLERSTIVPVNSGIVTFRRDALRFRSIEEYVDAPLLCEGHAPHWFAEQAIFCVEMNRTTSTPLSTRYAIIGHRMPDDVDALHFCASGARRKLFYSHGIAHVARALHVA